MLEAFVRALKMEGLRRCCHRVITAAQLKLYCFLVKTMETILAEPSLETELLQLGK